MVVALLTGPKCAGKKTAAAILRQLYGFHHIELDDYLSHPAVESLPDDDNRPLQNDDNRPSQDTSTTESFNASQGIASEFDQNDDSFCLTPLRAKGLDYSDVCHYSQNNRAPFITIIGTKLS